jgi:hypothetical protein
VTTEKFLRCSCVYFVTMLVVLWVVVGCMCNVNMCIMSRRRSCFVGSQKNSFITAHGVGMKFNACWSILKLLNSCDSTLESHS